MASDREFTEYVCARLSEVGEISYRPMMGEYVLYANGKMIGGVYDNRLLLKPTRGALRVLEAEGRTPLFDLPYPGAKQMLAVEPEDGDLLVRLVNAISDDLPAKKAKR